MRARVGWWLAFLALAAVLPAALDGPAARQAAIEKVPAPGEADQGPLVLPGEAPDLTLIYTGGVVGYVEPCG